MHNTPPAATTARALIDAAPLSRFQWQTFFLCFCVTLFDGFDTQAIAFTGPAIAGAFHLNPSQLTPLIVAGTLGMALGAIGLGSLGDRIGRRAAILVAVLIFALFSLATGFARSPTEILLARFFTGLGMGGAVPSVLSLVSELSPARHRGLLITGALLGLPAGAIVGGLLTSSLLPMVGWQGIYVIGGLAPLLFLPVLWFLLPESPFFLMANDPTLHQQTIHNLLRKLLPAVSEKELLASTSHLPEKSTIASVKALFHPDYLRNTLAVWLTYFCNWTAWFMLILWLPTALKTGGLPAAKAAQGTVMINTPAILFCLVMAYYLPRQPVRRLLGFTLLFGLLVVTSLGVLSGLDSQPLGESTYWLSMFCLIGAAGVGIGLPQIALNYVVLEAYPTALRATGSGWAIGMGRVGSILGAALGGLLLTRLGVAGFYFFLILPLLCAALGVWLIRTKAPALARIPPRQSLSR